MVGQWNYPLIAALCGIFLTQLLKFPLAFIFDRVHADLHIINATGGMPSSHSAAVTALITSLIIQNGLDSPYVAIAIIMGLIVMFDSIGVRRQCGDQGILQMRMLEVLKAQAKEIDDPAINQKIKHLEQDKLVIDDYFGHRPIEVIGGVLMGVIIALVLHEIMPA
ncbi:MAG: divergent PAP2 family protein [Aerococcus sp.]|nr:divergent PAP2 family protein [Aerococcus sp.]